MIEMYLLEQLAAFAKFGTLSEAANELYVSQPALSRSMKKLERMFDAELFSRSKNKIALNENGKLAAIFAQISRPKWSTPSANLTGKAGQFPLEAARRCRSNSYYTF